MSRISRTVGVMTLAVIVATPALAQNADTTQMSNRVLFLAAGGGGLSSTRDLDNSGTSNFKTGYNFFGSIGTRLQRYIALRGDVIYGKNELKANGSSTGNDLNKWFYGGALQFQYPMARLTPYAFLGGGGITLDQTGEGSNKTTGAGIVGLGLEFPFSGSGIGIFAQGSGLYYKISDMNGTLAGFDRNQFDITYAAGLSYRIPF